MFCFLVFIDKKITTTTNIILRIKLTVIICCCCHQHYHCFLDLAISSLSYCNKIGKDILPLIWTKKKQQQHIVCVCRRFLLQSRKIAFINLFFIIIKYRRQWSTIITIMILAVIILDSKIKHQVWFNDIIDLKTYLHVFFSRNPTIVYRTSIFFNNHYLFLPSIKLVAHVTFIILDK